MPTRLVDVGQAGSLRIVETKPNLIHAPYATLSYCWGGKNQLQLTESSLEDFKVEIPAWQLSFAILDEIYVVRQLKLRYLWVDSLCIIQNSKSDWEKEVITMGEVFRNSAITIAALGAKHSEEGLFARRDPLIYQPCNLFRRDGKDFFVKSQVDDSQFSDDWFEKSPLHQRGWVMQERALSPRTLNFGATVIWECSEGVKYEHTMDFELGTNSQDSPGNPTIKSRLHEPLKDEIAPDQTSLLFKFWREQILKPYTMTILTVKEDRLAAISGVIESIGKSTGWESVYGLWMPFLVEELLWHKFVFVPWRGDWRHQNDKDKLGQSRLRIAPTWSWVSLDIKIDFDSSSGKAPIRLFTTQVTVVSNTSILSKLGASPWSSRLKVMSKLYPSGSAVKGRSDLFNFLVDQTSFQATILFDIVPSTPKPYYYLPLIAQHFPNWYRAGDGGKIRFVGIVLVTSTDFPGAYERVGYSHSYVSQTVADDFLQNELVSIELV
ncbi:HET domain containing protein [Hyaloscypha variabilis]